MDHCGKQGGFDSDDLGRKGSVRIAGGTDKTSLWPWAVSLGYWIPDEFQTQDKVFSKIV